MCVGMGCCATLIGNTTQKVTYRRCASDVSSRLIWLQPGGQRIGDQTFDSYVYLESPSRPLQTWMSSKEVPNDDKFERYTLIAVAFALSGYIMQFIGLRGMKAWVSLSQLGVTVMMSILRGMLRMQRLSRDDNMVGDMPDVVVGHELDWLAFELEQLKCTSRLMWNLTGKYEAATTTTTTPRWATAEPKEGTASGRERGS